MKKQFINHLKYLFVCNAGQEGAGGPGASGGAGTGTEGGAPPTDGTTQAGATEQQAAKDWLSAIPEGLRKHEKLASIKTGEDLVKAYIAAEPASQVPESYKLPEGAPAELSDWAKSHKLSQEQLTGVLTKHQEIVNGQLKQRADSQKAAAVELFKTWGDAKDQNLQLANRVLAMSDPDGKLGVANFMKSAESGYAMMNPIVIQMFLRIGQNLKEGGFLKSESLQGAQQGTKKVNPAHEMYPDQAPKS